MCNLYTMTATVNELRRVSGSFDGYLVVKIIRLVPNCPRPQTTDIEWIPVRRLLRDQS